MCARRSLSCIELEEERKNSATSSSTKQMCWCKSGAMSVKARGCRSEVTILTAATRSHIETGPQRVVQVVHV